MAILDCERSCPIAMFAHEYKMSSGFFRRAEPSKRSHGRGTRYLTPFGGFTEGHLLVGVPLGAQRSPITNHDCCARPWTSDDNFRDVTSTGLKRAKGFKGCMRLPYSTRAPVQVQAGSTIGRCRRSTLQDARLALYLVASARPGVGLRLQLGEQRRSERPLKLVQLTRAAHTQHVPIKP